MTSAESGLGTAAAARSRRGRRTGEERGFGEETIEREILRGEDAVEAVKREGTFAIEEVRDVGLTEACLASEAGSVEGAFLDAAEEFEAKELVEILKVHRNPPCRANDIFWQDED